MLIRMRRYRWSRALYLVPILLIFKSALLHLNTVYIGKNGDSAQFIWYLGWFWHAVFTGQNPLVSHMLNYPYGVNLMTNTGIVAESVVFGPWFYLVGPIFSFNFLILVDLLCIGIIGAGIFDQLQVRSWLADLGAMLLGLSAFVVNQLVDGHINLITGYVLVLALISVVIRVVQGEKLRPVFYGSLLGLLVVVLFYTSLEIFAASALVLLCSLIIFGGVYRGSAWQICKNKLGLPFVIMSTIVIILAMPGLYELFFGINHFDCTVPVFRPNIVVTALNSFIIPSSTQVMLLPFNLGYYSEMNAYLGLSIILIIGLVISWREKFAYCLLSLGLLMSVFSMGGFLRLDFGSVTHISLPWRLLEGLPFMSDILPARLMAFADIAFIMFMTIGVEKLISRKSELGNIAISLLILTAINWFPNIPFWNQDNTQNFHSELQSQFIGKPIAIIEESFPAFSYDMLFLAAGHYAFPVTNAYQFPYMTGITSGQKYVTLFIFTQDYQKMSVIEAMQNLQKFVALRRPRYIVLLSEQLQMPGTLNQALNHLFGQPVQKEGAKIWTVR